MEIVGVTSRYSPAMIFNKLRIDVDDIPSRELAYPTLGKESHLQTCLGMGYVSSQEDISQMRTMTLEKEIEPLIYIEWDISWCFSFTMALHGFAMSAVWFLPRRPTTFTICLRAQVCWFCLPRSFQMSLAFGRFYCRDPDLKLLGKVVNHHMGLLSAMLYLCRLMAFHN